MSEIILQYYENKQTGNFFTMTKDIAHVAVYDSLYIGIREKGGFDTDKNPLSFLTYFDSDNTNFKKRKSTITRWCGTEGYHDFMDNEPLEGFKIVDFETRYSTSNKVFEVTDPRGFKLQISAENLVHLALNTTIEKGTIKDPCVWARRAGDNFLLPTTSKLYSRGTQEQVSIKDLKVNDRVAIGHYDKLFYQGAKYIVAVKAIRDYKKEMVPSNHPYHRGQMVEKLTLVGFKFGRENMGRYHVFGLPKDDYSYNPENVDSVDRNGHVVTPRPPELYVSKSVKIKFKEGNDSSYSIPEMDNRYYKINNEPSSLSRYGYGKHDDVQNYRVLFFDTKEEAEAFDVSDVMEYLKEGVLKQQNSIGEYEYDKEYTFN